MIRQIHVFDLDGVLVDSSHRCRFNSDGSLDARYWHENYTPEKIALDRLLPTSRKYISSLVNDSIFTIICTTRYGCAADHIYIDDKLGHPDKILFVGESKPPYKPAHELKRRQLQRILNLKQFQNIPCTLWEDNLKNIEALRDLFTHCIYIISKQGV